MQCTLCVHYVVKPFLYKAVIFKYMIITQCKLYNTPNVSSDHMTMAQTFKQYVWVSNSVSQITSEHFILSF